MLPATKFEENLLTLKNRRVKALQTLEMANLNFILEMVSNALVAGQTQSEVSWTPESDGVHSFTSTDFPTERTKEEVIRHLNDLGYWAYFHKSIGHCSYIVKFHWTHKKPSWLSQWWYGWQPPTNFLSEPVYKPL